MIAIEEGIPDETDTSGGLPRDELHEALLEVNRRNRERRSLTDEELLLRGRKRDRLAAAKEKTEAKSS